jgi:hypothetical protein
MSGVLGGETIWLDVGAMWARFLGDVGKELGPSDQVLRPCSNIGICNSMVVLVTWNCHGRVPHARVRGCLCSIRLG